MNRDHQVAKEFLTVNSNKILFGTDNMEFGLHALVESLGIEKDKLDHIYYKNATSIIG